MLGELGTERAWVVHGEDGLDEITLAGKTTIAEARNGSVRMFEIFPEDFGLTTQELDGLRGGDPDCNAAIVRSVLDGSRKDAARSLVVMNAAAALVVGNVVDDLVEGTQLANNVIDDGAALRKLEELARITSA